MNHVNFIILQVFDFRKKAKTNKNNDYYCIRDYESRDRTFGGVIEQLPKALILRTSPVLYERIDDCTVCYTRNDKVTKTMGR